MLSVNSINANLLDCSFLNPTWKSNNMLPIISKTRKGFYTMKLVKNDDKVVGLKFPGLYFSPLLYNTITSAILVEWDIHL